MLFFPIGDPQGLRYRSRSYAVFAIIALNIAAYLLELSVSYPDGYVDMVYTLGMTPVAVRNQTGLGGLTAITSLFLHSRANIPMHLIGNMVVFWCFGRRVEDACGHVRFLLFYMTAGLCANLLQLLLSAPDETIPSIGASGAVAGVMGAYLVLFPTARIRTIFWVIIPIPYPIYMRAFWYLIPWLIFQVLPSIDVVSGTAEYGVAYFAHLGGFLGALLIFLFLRKDALYRYLVGVDL